MSEQETFHGELRLSRDEVSVSGEAADVLHDVVRRYSSIGQHTRRESCRGTHAKESMVFRTGNQVFARSIRDIGSCCYDDGPNGIVTATPATPGDINGAIDGPVPGNLTARPLAIPSAAPNVTSLR